MYTHVFQQHTERLAYYTRTRVHTRIHRHTCRFIRHHAFPVLTQILVFSPLYVVHTRRRRVSVCEETLIKGTRREGLVCSSTRVSFILLLVVYCCKRGFLDRVWANFSTDISALQCYFIVDKRTEGKRYTYMFLKECNSSTS